MKKFIGRKNVLETVRKGIFVTEPGQVSSYSIMGLNGIGKTQLVKHWAKQWENEKKDPNIYYIYTSLNKDEVKDGRTFWADFVNLVKEQVTEKRLNATPIPELKKDDKDWLENREEWIKSILTIYQKTDNLKEVWLNDDSERASDISKIFRLFTKLGIHLIIVIDEFDDAITLFPKVEGEDNGAFFRRLFDMSAKRGDYYLSVLLISRRQVGTIAHGMPYGSNFEDAYVPYPLNGFTYSEVMEYLMSLDNYQRLQSDEDFAKIVGYCGTHPGLLETFGEAIDSIDEEEKIDIDNIMFKHKAATHRMFERMHSLMKTEYLNADKSKNCVGVFKQCFLGPMYEDDDLLKKYLEDMQKYGYVMQRGEKQPKIFDLAGYSKEQYEEYCRDSFAEQNNYEPVSPYFVYYMKYNISPEELDDFDKLRSYTELNVRSLIEEVYQRVYGATWKEQLEYADGRVYSSRELKNIFDNKQKFRTNMDTVARANGHSTSQYTSLNTLAFNEYMIIIMEHWNEMKKYFSSYSLSDLKNDFFYLNVTRNTIAHENRNILNEEYYRIAQEVCERINKNIDNGRKGITSNEGTKPSYATRFSGWNILITNNGDYQKLVRLSAQNGSNNASGNVAASAPAHVGTTTQNTAATSTTAPTMTPSVAPRIVYANDNQYADIKDRVGGNPVNFYCVLKNTNKAVGCFDFDGVRYNVQIGKDLPNYDLLHRSVNPTDFMPIIIGGIGTDTDKNGNPRTIVLARPAGTY